MTKRSQKGSSNATSSVASRIAFRLKHRNKKLKQFGIDQVGFEEILENQSGGCAICGKTAEELIVKYLSVDYCYKKGQIRAILCERCIRVLSFSKNDSELLRAAAAYLEDTNDPT